MQIGYNVIFNENIVIEIGRLISFQGNDLYEVYFITFGYSLSASDLSLSNDLSQLMRTGTCNYEFNGTDLKF